MSIESPAAPPSSRARRWIILGVVSVILVVLGWRLWVHGSAQIQLREGKSLLDQDRVEEARSRFDRCLETWPESGEVHFLAARAARRCGDLETARRHLNQATAHGWSADDIALERSLARVQEGEFDAEEPYLLRLLANKHPDSGIILEVVTLIYFSRYHLDEAKFCASKWVELRPQSAKAWNYQGEIQVRLGGRERSVASFREALRLKPEYRAARINLITSLLELKQSPAEVEAALEPLIAEAPDDPIVMKLHIRCREVQGRYDQAAELAETMLKKHPHSVDALIARGRLELERGKAAAAVPYLREAVTRSPYDPDALYTLWRCLNELGPVEEAAALQARIDKVERDLKRLIQLTRQIVADSNNPDLRREAGEICLRNGLEKEGERWLETALKVRPDDGATHRVLADFYTRTNRPDRASFHRDFSKRDHPLQPKGPEPGVRKPDRADAMNK